MLTFSRVIFLACIVAGSGLFSSAATAADLKISWHVENRFPFYRKASTFRKYERTAQDLQKAAHGDWILRTERQLQDDHRDKNTVDAKVRDPATRLRIEEEAWKGWASEWREDTCWDRQNHFWTERRRCGEFFRPGRLPISHLVIATVENAAPGAECRWTVEVVKEKNVKASEWYKRRDLLEEKQKLKQRALPCSQSIKVEVPYSPKGETDPGKGGFQTVLRVTSGNDSKEEIIQVNDLLVVGMGDSFAAGVGNPDKPARIEWPSGVKFVNPGEKNIYLPKRYGDGEKASSLAKAQAEWLDIRCFRSQYGPQFRAALHLAVSLPHSSVTYVDLACNGARIIEGLLNKKGLDGGYSYQNSKNLPRSQIEIANEILCSKTSLESAVSYQLVPARTAAACSKLRKDEICDFFDVKYKNIDIDKTAMKVCKATRGDRFTRPIDVLLLSIGGNDIGFAAMVADVMIDDKTRLREAFKNYADRAGISHSGKIGAARLELLNSKYAVLNKALSDHLPWRPGQQAADQKKPIFLTAYPMPLDDQHGALCGTKLNVKAAGAAFNVSTFFTDFATEGKDKNRPVTARMNDVIKTSCALNLRRFGWMDGGPDRKHIINDLTKKGALCADMDDLAKARPGESKIPWHYVGDFLPDYRRHGFCAYKNDPEELRVPKKREGSLIWDPDYHKSAPYLSRARWLRTPNDAFVITNWYAGRNVDHYENLFYAATTTAMHPTAEGFAAMGDGILKRVTEYLCKERGDVMNKEAKEKKEKLCPLLTDKISAGETEQKNAAVQ